MKPVLRYPKINCWMHYMQVKHINAMHFTCRNRCFISETLVDGERLDIIWLDSDVAVLRMSENTQE